MSIPIAYNFKVKREYKYKRNFMAGRWGQSAGKIK